MTEPLPAPTQQIREPASPTPRAGTRAKILVVDDEPDTIELITFNLRNAGYEVITAADGAEVYTQQSTFKGLSRRLDSATFHDLGGTVWN